MSQRCFYDLITVLTEVEAVLNTQPLTYVYVEFDSGITLTPAHFLVSYFPPLLLSSADLDEEDKYYNAKDLATSYIIVIL